VLVLGGGPAGATLAALAARAGKRTLLVERSRFPRDKVCGEFLSAAGCSVLGRLGVLPRVRAAGAASLQACRVTHPRGPALELDLPRPGTDGCGALGLSRARLDSTLLEFAGEQGVEVLQPWEALRPIVEAGVVRGVVVRATGGEATREIAAGVVAAADGRRSVLVRHLHPKLGDPGRSGPRSWFGLARHLDGAGNLPPGRIELHLFDGGYAGIGPVEGGRLNLGLIVTVESLRDCGGSPERLYRERLLANPLLCEALGGAEPSGRWRSVGPLSFGARRPAAGGVLFVGDAAGTVDPFCGEGMSNALCGAELALPFVVEALARGAVTPGAARRYTAAWHAAFARPTRRARSLGRLLERPRLARPVLGLLDGALCGLAPRLLAATRGRWTGP